MAALLPADAGILPDMAAARAAVRIAARAAVAVVHIAVAVAVHIVVREAVQAAVAAEIQRVPELDYPVEVHLELVFRICCRSLHPLPDCRILNKT